MVQHAISKPLEMIFNASFSTGHIQSCLKIAEVSLDITKTRNGDRATVNWEPKSGNEYTEIIRVKNVKMADYKEGKGPG